MSAIRCELRFGPVLKQLKFWFIQYKNRVGKKMSHIRLIWKLKLTENGEMKFLTWFQLKKIKN